MEEILRRFATDLLSALHAAHPAEFFFEIEVLAVNSEWVGVFSKTDGVVEDCITVNLQMSPKALLKKINDVKPANTSFHYELWKDLERDQRPILGYTKRQIYMLRGGFSPEMWTRDQAFQQLKLILSTMTTILAPALRDEWLSLSPKQCSWSAFEDLVRRTINCLFTPQLGEAHFQSRTDVDSGEERRDVIAHNKADLGIWKDLKDKYASSEILFEAKCKTTLERDDLRQTYCYLKASLGYWGFFVFRGPKDEGTLAYNLTLCRNFSGTRGVLILNHEDFRKMLEIKIRDDDPTDYLRSLYSQFNQKI
jgi:hypothetical protein